MITLACATRRPLALRRALETALEKADKPDSIQVIVRVDTALDAICIPRTHPNDFYIVGPRLGKGAARPINQAAMAGNGILIMQFTDDQEVVTPGWDSLLLEEWMKVGGVPSVFQVDEGRTQLENPIVTRMWLQEVGCLYPWELVHFYSDTFVEVLAQKSGRLIKVPHVQIKHHKHQFGGDTSHKECREGHAADAAAFIGLRERIELLVKNLAH